MRWLRRRHHLVRGLAAALRLRHQAEDGSHGKCVVVTALDYGPDVCVETAAGQPILDASPLVGKHLFGESGVGYSDKLAVKVTPVAASTKLGPCTGDTEPTEPEDPTTPTTCQSATLDREVEAGCVQDSGNA